MAMHFTVEQRLSVMEGFLDAKRNLMYLYFRLANANIDSQSREVSTMFDELCVIEKNVNTIISCEKLKDV
jgi:hypothetical protein